MPNFRYSILLVLILSTHLFNFAVVQRDNSTPYDGDRKSTRESSKRLKKLKIKLGELVFKRFVLKTKNRNNNKKSTKSKINSQDWSDELLYGFATFATLIFCVYKHYKYDDNVSYN
jgi:hypothetical protein